jgi:hypothetical protein
MTTGQSAHVAAVAPGPRRPRPASRAAGGVRVGRSGGGRWCEPLSPLVGARGARWPP